MGKTRTGFFEKRARAGEIPADKTFTLFAKSFPVIKSDFGFPEEKGVGVAGKT